MRKLIWVPFLLIFCNSVLAIHGDSLTYLTPQDTMVLKIGDYGEKIFVHTLKPQQTLYSLARFYGLRMGRYLLL